MNATTHKPETSRSDTDRSSDEPQLQQNIQQCLANVAFAFDEQLKQAVSASEQVVRKQVLTELRARYGQELSLAQTERDRIAGRLQIATTKTEEAERDLTKLQVEFQQIQIEKMDLEASLQCAQQSALKLSEAQQSLAELQTQAGQLAAEKLEIETKLQQTETSLLSDFQTRFSEAEQTTLRLRADLERTQDEKQEVEVMLAKANSKFTEIEQSLISLRSELESEQSSKQELESRLAEADIVAEQSRLSLSEIERKLENEIAAREDFEARLKTVTESRVALETKLADAQSTCAELESQFNQADNGRSVLERQVEKIQAELQAAKAEPRARNIPKGKGGVSTISSDKLDV